MIEPYCIQIEEKKILTFEFSLTTIIGNTINIFNWWMMIWLGEISYMNYTKSRKLALSEVPPNDLFLVLLFCMSNVKGGEKSISLVKSVNQSILQVMIWKNKISLYFVDGYENTSVCIRKIGSSEVLATSGATLLLLSTAIQNPRRGFRRVAWAWAPK